MKVRPAGVADLPAIIRLLTDDPLEAGRKDFDDPLPTAYSEAFEAIAQQRGNQVLVANRGRRLSIPICTSGAGLYLGSLVS